MSGGPRKSTCIGCPHDLHYTDAVPKRQFGVMMHIGEHFCTGGKRARRFKRSDPKIYVPSWCPKRKSPCELRVYGFRNGDVELLHRSLCASLGEAIVPSASRYALEHESHTDLTPQEFWKRCDLEPSDSLLPVEVGMYCVVEIDDGLCPAFFYKTEGGYEYLISFDADIARKNAREGSV